MSKFYDKIKKFFGVEKTASSIKEHEIVNVNVKHIPSVIPASLEEKREKHWIKENEAKAVSYPNDQPWIRTEPVKTGRGPSGSDGISGSSGFYQREFESNSKRHEIYNAPDREMKPTRPTPNKIYVSVSAQVGHPDFRYKYQSRSDGTYVYEYVGNKPLEIPQLLIGYNWVEMYSPNNITKVKKGSAFSDEVNTLIDKLDLFM